jgi:dTDP-4-amino-4,6-dideoxygalactose transaminase
MNNKLVIDGGKSVRETEFKSKPYVTEKMKSRVIELMENKQFSKFIGSPVPGTLDYLVMKSIDMAKVEDVTTFLGGPSVRGFEAEWSKAHQCDYSITVNSATSGLTTAIMACDIGPGDEVICSPFSFTASATSIISANAVPVFADIDLETFCLSADSVKESLTESTKALMPIHWNSNAGDLDEIIAIANSNSLKVIEDAAQTPGMTYKGKNLGTHGDVGVFSLNEPKNIMTGEGGVIVTNNKDIARKCRLIRNHGEAIVDDLFTSEMATNIVGANYRLVELLAEIGRCQLEDIELLNNIRRDNYHYLVDQLVSYFGEFIIPQRITNADSYYPYTAGFRWLSKESGLHRNVLARVLRTEGIPVSSGLPRLMSDNPIFQNQLAYGKHSCPFDCHLYKRRGLYAVPDLPNATRLQEEEYIGFFQIGWPNTKNDIDDIIKGIHKVLKNKKRLAQEPVHSTSNFISGR